MTTRRSVLFSGYYGMHNTGDDVFCAVCAWAARHYWDCPKVGFLTNTIPQLPAPGRAILPARQRFRGQSRLVLYKELLKGPAVVFAGGSTFYSAKHGTLRSQIEGLQRIRRFEMGAVGVSLGPYKNEQARSNVREFLARFKFLALRDRKSYEDACDMNLPYRPVDAFDMALLLPQVYGSGATTQAQEASRPVLGVCLCHHERYHDNNVENEQRRETTVLGALKKVVSQTNCDVKCFAFNGHPRIGDHELAESTAAALGECAEGKIEVVSYSPDPRDFWDALASCTAVLSVRLHGGILAWTAGVPTLMVEYHRKCTDFLDDVQCPSELRIGDADLSADELAEKLQRLLHEPVSPGSELIEAFTLKAERNFVDVL